MMSRSKILVAKWAGAFLLFFCSFSYSNAQISPVVTNPTFYDDTNVHVPLQFGFPFYGQVFTNSWMHSNGVVSFLDPMTPIPNAPYNPAQWAYCCQGINLVPGNVELGPQFNYMIAPLWTDLYPVATSTFRTEGTSQYQLYQWNNIAEISNMNNLNTFSLEIRPSGFIGATYQQINIQNQAVTAGVTGDVSLGQMQQFYYGIGIPNGALSNWSINSTTIDQCLINPLSSPTCAGYTEAMCVINPLYNQTCSGYQQAYFTQQCSINALYDPNCPGYAAAYLLYQCSINPLYSTTCQGYSEAYAKKQALEQTNIEVAVVEPSQQTTLVSDPVVNSVVTSTATSASPAQSATATVPLVSSPTITAVVVTQEVKKEEKKDATEASTSTSSSSTSTASTSQSSTSKDQPKTARQELQERRVAAARAKAVEDGKQLADTVGKANSMEQQAAVQNVIIAAMGHTPGFDSYGKVFIPDSQNYRPFTIYNNQKNVDNRANGLRLFGGTDSLHKQMVDAQYK